MNEQIKQLADRLWRVHPADIDALGLKSRTEFYEQELKKFAQLIVRECAGIYDKIDNGNLHMGTDDYLEALDKTFFGVDE